jgi:hypothetical protein
MEFSSSGDAVNRIALVINVGKGPRGEDGRSSVRSRSLALSRVETVIASGNVVFERRCHITGTGNGADADAEGAWLQAPSFHGGL